MSMQPTCLRRSYLTPAGESTLSKRNALFGSSNSSQTHLNDPYGGPMESHMTGGSGTYYGSRSPSPYAGARPASSASQYASNRTAEDLESQNEEELEGLGAKVKILKDVSRLYGQSCLLQLTVISTDHHQYRQ